MKIAFDPAKRTATLRLRGLDFADAAEVFTNRHATDPDLRKEYGEQRFITGGIIRGRVVVLVWTERNASRRIISMSYSHEREAERWQRRLD